MVSLSCESGKIWLGEKCRDCGGFQVADFAARGTFLGNVEHRRALTCGKGLLVYQEAEKAPQSGESAVTCSDRCLSLLLAIFQESQDFSCGEISQIQPSNLLSLSLCDMTEE